MHCGTLLSPCQAATQLFLGDSCLLEPKTEDKNPGGLDASLCNASCAAIAVLCLEKPRLLGKQIHSYGGGAAHCVESAGAHVHTAEAAGPPVMTAVTAALLVLIHIRLTAQLAAMLGASSKPMLAKC